MYMFTIDYVDGESKNVYGVNLSQLKDDREDYVKQMHSDDDEIMWVYEIEEVD